MIIAAYSGTGKTTLAARYPETFIDFVCMPYKYYLNPYNSYGEASKADPDNIMQDDWPFNYVSAIKGALGSGKTLLIPSDFFVLMLLRDEKLPYILCYPQRNAKRVYKTRFLKRGNTREFIKVFIGRWKEFIEGCERDSYGHHIILKPDQFLSDVIDPNFITWYTKLDIENIGKKE
jgi:hypothetical protein